MGFVITLMLVSSLIVGIPSTASAAAESWSTLALPSATGLTLADVDITQIVTVPGAIYASAVCEGSAVLPAWTANRYRLIKSTDAGKTWSVMAGTASGGLALGAGIYIVDIVASPQNTNTIYVAVTDGVAGSADNQVYKSTNGGSSFLAPYGVPVAGVIESLDVSWNGTNTVLVVGSTGDAAATNILTLQDVSLAAWQPFGSAIGGWVNVWDVKFAPNFATNGGLVAVVDDGAATFVTTRVGAGGWSIASAKNTVAAAAPAPIAPVHGAFIGLPSDYDPVSAPELFVGTNGTGTDNVFDVDFNAAPLARAPGAVLTVPAANTSVSSMAVTGSAVAGSATIVIGANAVAAATNTGMVFVSKSNGGSWTFAAKNPAGGQNAGAGVGSNTQVALAGDFSATNPTIYAGTIGQDQATLGAGGTPDGLVDNSEFAVSTDYGANFNGRALCDTAVTTIEGLKAAGASTALFMVATDANTITSIWRTSNVTVGNDWWRIYSAQDDAAAASPFIVVQPTSTFDTDKTLWVAVANPTGGTLDTMSSTNADTSAGFSGVRTAIVAGTCIPTAMAVASPTVVFIGDSGGMVIRTRDRGANWSTNTPGGAVTSLATSPTYSADSGVLVGDAAGAVFQSTNGGSAWTALVGGVALAGNEYVAFDPAFSTNAKLYTGDATGTNRWDGAATGGWVRLDTNANFPAAKPATNVIAIAGPSGLTTPTATLYSVDPTAAATAVVTNLVGSVKRTVNSLSSGGVGGSVAQEWLGQTIPLAGVTFNCGAGGQSLSTAAPAAVGNNVWAVDTALQTVYAFSDKLAVQSVIATPSSITLTTAALTWSSLVPSGDTWSINYVVQGRVNGSGTAFGTAFASPAVTSNNWTAAALTPSTKYDIRVRATVPNCSYYSATVSFTTMIGAGPWDPSQNSAGAISINPAPGATVTTVTPILSWNTAAGATGFELQLSANADMSSPAIDLSGASAIANGSQTTYAIPAASKLTDGNVYYWHVRAVMSGAFSSYSGTFAFQVSVPKTTTTSPPVTITQPPATTMTLTVSIPAAPPVTTTVITQPPATTTTIVMTQAPATTITIPPAPAQPTPAWVWAIIAIGGILLIVVIVLIARTRKV